jgi:endonuclease/exonuclease/phosphatase family metal-dependent hydrolase
MSWGSLAVADSPEQIRVMSFNIRYGTARDGENAWELRKEFLVDTIKKFGPDLLGTQETLDFQRDYLAEQLAEYGVLGVGRDDGQRKGEMMALYYRKSRFTTMSEGHFWLSETPEVIGSKSWDSALPRMVTWIKLSDRGSHKPILFLNTHFDHLGETARRESALLLREKLVTLGRGCHVIVTGDFNAGTDSQPYAALFGTLNEQRSPVVDTYRVAQPNPGTEEGTFSGFDPTMTTGPRIDWIGVSRNWQVLTATIDRTARGKQTPSDHFPITAIILNQSATE